MKGEGEIRNTKKHVLVLSIVLSVMLGAIFLIPNDIGHGPTSASVISGSVIQQFQEVDEGENVRVFVKLKDVEDVEGIGPIKSVREAILENQKDNLKEDIEDKTRYDFGDLISADLTQKEIEALALSGAVEIVEIVESRELFLGSSVPLIGANEVWNFDLGDSKLTGLGQSVCVLDTGIDYNHEDLLGKVLAEHDFANDDNDSIDDHNHGTHVAGIIGANGNVTGVAPGSNFVSVKVCTASGLCFDDDIIAGINYCLNNSKEFNISVISMSLGGGLYQSYCNDDPLAASIDEVVANNISMVIASGNSGNSGGISAPACVESSLSVGSTTKSDEISSFSNRNSLLDVMAPGSSIYSTLRNQGHGILSGTSMSTPHVSGVLAVLNQYLAYVGIVKTPLELENILKQSGKLIEDSRSGLNYSRVDLYQALKLLDNEKPEVSFGELLGDNYNCLGKDLKIVSGMFELSNSSDLIHNFSYEGLNISLKEMEIDLTNVSSGIYDLNCLFEDWNGNIGSGNTSVIVSFVSVENVYPLVDELVRSGEGFVCNVSSDMELSEINASIYYNGSVLFEDYSNISGLENLSEFDFDFEELTRGNYSLICGALNTLGKSWVSSEINFEYRSTKIELDILLPLENNYTNSKLLEFSSDVESACSYTLTNVSREVISNDSLYFISEMNLSEGNSSVEVRCISSLENLSSNKTINFFFDTTAPVINLDRPRSDEELEEGNIVFSYEIVENNSVYGCNLLINNGSVSDSSGASSSFEKVFSAIESDWAVSCSDEAGNRGYSEIRPLKVVVAAGGSSQEESSGSPSEGGGGGSAGSSGSGGSLSSSSDETATVQEIQEIQEIQEEPRISIGEAGLTNDAVNNEENGVSAGLTGQAIGKADESGIDKRVVLIILGIFGLVGFFAYRQGKKFFNGEEEKLVHGLR